MAKPRPHVAEYASLTTRILHNSPLQMWLESGLELKKKKEKKIAPHMYSERIGETSRLSQKLHQMKMIVRIHRAFGVSIGTSFLLNKFYVKYNSNIGTWWSFLKTFFFCMIR